MATESSSKKGHRQVGSFKSAQVDQGGWDTPVPARGATESRLPPSEAEENIQRPTVFEVHIIRKQQTAVAARVLMSTNCRDETI